MRKALAMILLFTLAVAVAIVWRSARTSGPSAVFLSVVDTLRPDRLSCYGYEAYDTRYIDRLAGSGVIFVNAQSSASWTVPSMGSMMTSLYPSQLGLVEMPRTSEEQLQWRDRREQLGFKVPRTALTLPGILADEGFHTVAFVNQPALNARRGFVEGFEDWFFPGASSEIRRAPESTAGRGEKTWSAGPNDWNEQARADAKLVAAFAEWLSSHSRERMFVWLHLLSPHMPYSPPRRYRVPRDKQRRSSALYDGEVRYVDDLMLPVLDAIEKEVGLEKSIIVFTSDHGEEFGEHGMFEHGHSLHREVMWVPLIIAGAGLSKGNRIETYVSTTDIMPTVLDIVGLPKSPDLVGRSLMPFMASDSSGVPVYAEGVLYGSSERVLVVDGYKLMYDDQDPQLRLFDAERDQGERVDLVDTDPPRVAEMRSRLDAIHHEAVDYRNARFPETQDSLVSAEERENINRAMRALGYIND
jgi:arylsulfatase A-like enzyme